MQTFNLAWGQKVNPTFRAKVLAGVGTNSTRHTISAASRGNQKALKSKGLKHMSLSS